MMGSHQQFCTECGAPWEPGAKFCEQCGKKAEIPQGYYSSSPPVDVQEKLLGIIPFVFFGSSLSPRYHTLVLTGRNFIFIPFDLDKDIELADSRDSLTDEDTFDEVGDSRSFFIRKNWSSGPWMRYADKHPAQLLEEHPDAVVVPYDSITGMEILNDTGYSTDDAITIRTKDATLEWTAEFAQGPRLFSILEPVLHEKISMDSVGDEETG
ncbi:MAG: hypothetical protein A4E40_00009 [Methanoregulaceae archaeon PtaU1.Bin059]|nr:MAG: hypothetical protein A4E40_00009 [Methanoregulaceae archaeon PtaU1.Bin059]